MQHLFLVIALLVLAAGPVEATPAKRVATARPSVVKTVPPCGDTRVDPAITEIHALFSKDMTDGNWSWCRADEGLFPDMTGAPHYLKDKRTCVLPVKLKPKTTYAIWLNVGQYTNFKDTDQRPAVPYLLVFETQ